MKFNREENYTLEDERVLLRPLEGDDFTHLKDFSINEPDLWTYSLTPAAGEENLKAYIDHALQQKEKGNSYPFIVWDKQIGAYAGSTRFYDIQPQHYSMQMGYTWYGRDFQGTGLNKHCKFLLLSFAFETLEAERVEFRADARNDRSIAAMKSIGCTPEGILRSNCVSPDGRRDSIVLSILKNEWFTSVKRNLKSKL
ncbi:MAG: GNAT family N-acetyltransferase [Bacteroidia bacterium]|nr:GNAT family N-acetyltransferase [Bacteroidia bacterium]NNF31344.1 GNAT family N-acetyltransferase [Flavobacteriaceae bacterium]MBT8276580.1 GNAT family N-acetyltransferase [Bacteroidia bacterium]NNJ82555.1 GNAT family N-acetyltransferase [Flavobacteriaceae bacterium]NNK54382.1 GNAT family N-acetyltransferase [Flavobacteriaceae bacterium]